LGVIPLIRFKGKLPRQNASLAEAQKVLSSEQQWYTPPQVPKAQSPYLKRVLQGATIVPRGLWFVRLPSKALFTQTVAPRVETDGSIEPNAKAPWRGLRLSGTMEAVFLYATILSEDLLPFATKGFRPIVVPMLRGSISREGPTTSRMLNAVGAAEGGFQGLAAWLKRAEAEYNIRKKATTKMTIHDRLDYSGLLTGQVPDQGYKVIYNAAGTHIAAAVLDASVIREARGVPVRGFIADAKTYLISVKSSDEAHYLCALLNSPAVDHAIKPYQTKGLFGSLAGGGERDIHRRPFEVVAIPEFDDSNPVHRRLAELGRACVEPAVGYAKIASGRIGLAREDVRGQLKEPIRQIDELAKGLLLLGTANEPNIAEQKSDDGSGQQELPGFPR